MKIRRSLPHILLILLLLTSACQALPTQETQTRPDIQLEDCQLSTPGVNINIPAKCGEYEVFEDRAAGSGRKIKLNLAVIPAVSRTPAADPVFYLAGGPGEAATQSFLSVYGALNQVNQKRDLVLVDQRGTGGSNPLNCMEDESTGLEDDLDTKTYLEDCLLGLEADPHLYTTSIAMDDLDEIRQALGYEQINLYGVSYGTRAAMVYARQHPAQVRTLILDGVAPLDWTIGPTVAMDAQNALDLMLSNCLDEEACSTAFPGIKNEFQSVMEQLEDEPEHISLMHPSSGENTELTLTYDLMANTVHLLSYAPETMALIPLMVHQAYEYGNFTSLAAQTLSTNTLLSSQISVGMRFSVICSEDQPFYSQNPPSQGYLGDQYERVFNEACEFWPAEAVSTDFKQALTSDIPTLLISGELDPVTPPRNGDQAARTLEHSLHIIVPYHGHGNLFRGCLPDLTVQFVETASVDGLDTSCVQELKPAPFFINLNGPKP